MLQANKKYKRTTVTSALPYANGPVHIGHLAGVYIPADIYVRYLRSKNEDVLFIGGSDEHGVPITIKARQEGVSPQQIVDKYHGIIKKSFEEFGISFDIYSRTSNKTHHETASEFFTTLYDKGEFIEKTTQQYYDEEAKHFLADRYITGTCPHCNNEKAYGDQCENCGTSLNATDLINPRSVLSGNPPVLKDTKHWFLPLDKYEPWLKTWILEGHKDDWKINVYGQCKSWLDQGLQPRAVTRDLDWGVKVPLDGADGKVLYVWFDAPIGYISATKEWAAEHGKDWKTYWKDEETRLLHFIGKDNIVFHCIVFPSMLHAEGSYILPDNVPANEFLNLEGDKISTSRNWAVWLHEYLLDFPGKQDVLRYSLCATAPETKDNDFKWKDFQTKNNSELVAIFGNFVNRVFVLIHKFYGGKVPNFNPKSELFVNYDPLSPHFGLPASETSNFDGYIKNYFYGQVGVIESLLDNFEFREALHELMNICRQGNFLLQVNEPWKTFNNLASEYEKKRLNSVMNVSVQLVALISIICEPFLPFTSEKLKAMLNLHDNKAGMWSNCKKDLLKNGYILEPGHQINEPSLLFDKIEDDAIAAQVARLLQTKADNVAGEVKANPAKENISYDDFMKMDIRTATILEAERVPKTKKLLKLLVDTGIDKRTVVSGIAEFYEPENIIGQQVVILLNLAPREIKGIVSQGMILMAENAKGELCFVTTSAKGENGNEIR
jgi:methionyl-tRNA synthetase